MSIPEFRGLDEGDEGREPQSMTRSAFESLGIVMDNGKPKFRINEPVFNSGLSLKSQLFQQEEDDETSFVVLGQSSMDYINTASLADYEQIKEQSLAVDTSIVSTLSHEEIEKKVVELLQENKKLKDTLSQNNNTMKHHFNTLSVYQKELKKVHDNHKQKFAETRDLMKILKTENAEMKTKLAMECSTNTRFSGEKIGEPLLQAQEWKKSLELPQQISITSQPPSNIDSNLSVLTEALQNSSISSNPSMAQPQVSSTNYYQEIIDSLKAQIKILSEGSFVPLGASSLPPSEKNCKEFLENFTHYNEKLSTLARCYTSQLSRFTDIQECLRLCIETLDFYEKSEPSEQSSNTRVTHKQVLDEARKQLISEQLYNINERQHLIEAQKQFEKIFSDYNCALHELEILKGENSKSFSSGKLDILKGKEELGEARETLEADRRAFLEAKVIFEQEKEALKDERASLDSQSVLYETQMKDLQANATARYVLEKRQDLLATELVKLKKDMEDKDIELEGLRARLALSKDDKDYIEQLQAQVESYKLDFEEEKRARGQLLSEREELTGQLGNIREYNQTLLRRLNGPNIPTAPNGIPIDEFCQSCGLYKMPGQWHGPGFCQPVD